MLIDREKLKDIIPAIAGKMKFRPAIVEKDYYLTVILNNIESLLTDKVVFKGGTLLNKAHLNYHRLSEDLDFTYNAEFANRATRSKAITPIREKMLAFLKTLGMTSDKPEGEGFNDSTQYVFKVKYPSILMAKDDIIKIEVSLRQPPIESPVHTLIKHFYQDPFSGEDLFPTGKVWSLSWKEAVAEKLKAAISRKDVAIRDYYDLWYISEFGFDFYDKSFIKLFKRKITDEGYAGDYKENFGLSSDNIAILRKQIDGLLRPVIRSGEEFDFDKTLERFNVILQKV
ncbi:MAG TPA: nucleotidyl transferase AbiEii/AbiGii toxin family protein [Candidatus Omnitrophota bacterium]|nr:nucleotidyl transferase AbiEii/AbiGii toxin family protein [Candidatus Omnitrophota bacterium]